MNATPFDRLDSARRSLDRGRPDWSLALLVGTFPVPIQGEALLLRAEALRAQGFFRRAIAAYRDALARLDVSDRDLAAQACLGLTRCHRSLGEVISAKKALQRAARHGARLGGEFQETVALENALVDRAAGAYPAALKAMSALLASCRRRRDHAGVGYLLWAMGGARRFAGDLINSHRDFRNSYISFRKASDREGQVYALFGLGGIARIRGRFKEARRSYAVAGHLLGRGPDLFGRAYAHCGLANVLRQLGRWSEAERHYQASYALYARLDDRVDLAYVDWGLGQVHLKRGELDGALRRFAAARNAFSRFGEARGEALSLQALSQVKHALGQTAEAEKLFDAAVKRSRDAGLHAHLEIFT